MSLRTGTTQQGLSYIACGSQDSKLSVICIHGWACRSFDFTYLFGELQKQDLDFQALAVDLPGHGKSSMKNYPIASISTFAEGILSIINELRISNVVLAGHSMGCRVVLETWKQACAAGQPNVKGLVFLDGSHYKFRNSVFSFDSGDPRSKSMSPQERAEKMADAFKTMYSARTPSEFRESTIAHVKGIDVEYNKAMRESFINYDYEQTDEVLEEVGKAGTPLLNLQSTNVDEKNRRTPLKSGVPSRWMRHVQDNVPQAQQLMIADSSHFPHVDQPVEVARWLREFVGGLDGQSEDYNRLI